jgi:hypothetical protein
MITQPDESQLPAGFGSDVVARATAGLGIWRQELERLAGQNCRRWMPYLIRLAASHGMRVIRHEHQARNETRFTMEKL